MDELGESYSEGELALVLSGIVDDFRIDGRTCYDIRKTKIRTGHLPSCNGSSQAQSTNCTVVVGVKVEIGRPEPDEPNCGIVEFSVDCSANASPKFEGRGGEDLSQEISIVLTNALKPAINRESLCITEGHKVWIIYVDVLVLECNCASQLIDLTSLAIKAALQDTKIPKITADDNDADDFVINPDLEEYCPFDVDDLPILLTLTRIQNKYLADVTEVEAAAGIARLTMAYNPKGQLLYTKKSGSGSLNAEALAENNHNIIDVMMKASKLAVSIHKDLDSQIASQKPVASH